MGSRNAKPSVVVTTPKPKTTIKHTTTPTTPTTPTIPTTIATTPEPTTTPLSTTATPARITSEGLITHSSINQLDSKSRACCTTPTTIMTSSVLSTPPLHATPFAYGPSTSSPSATSQSPFLLPLAIAMSTSFLVVAFILLLFVLRRRPNSDKQVGNSGNIELAPTQECQVFSSATLSAETSMECSLNHIYVEHDRERDSKQHDGMYTYVTKPSIIGGLPKGYAPSVMSPRKIFRGHPDGKSRSVQTKGFTTVTDAFGDEDHYNLLFENRPSVVNVLVMNTYENHLPNDCHQNYANVTEIPETTTEFLEAPPTNSEDTISIKSGSVSINNRDSGHETVSAVPQHHPCFSMCAPVDPANPTTGYDPNGSTRLVMAKDPEVVIGVKDDVLYENAPMSRAGTVQSRKAGEPQYYVLERQFNESTDITEDDNEMVENILYQSITE